MPKAFVEIRGTEIFQGKLHVAVDTTVTDNSGNVIGFPQFYGGQLPRKSIPFDGVAANLINAIEAMAIAVAGGIGQVIVAADVVLATVAQGA